MLGRCVKGSLASARRMSQNVPKCHTPKKFRFSSRRGLIMTRHTAPFIIFFFACAAAHAGDGNRLTYLDENNPYYPNRNFPKLTTPMWVGEDGVEAVVIIAIDDMRGHEKWET